MTPWREFLGSEGSRMTGVGVECEQEGRPALHDSDSGVGVSVDAAFVSLRKSECPLQVEIVWGQFEILSTGEQARSESDHRTRRVLPGGIGALS